MEPITDARTDEQAEVDDAVLEDVYGGNPGMSEGSCSRGEIEIGG